MVPVVQKLFSRVALFVAITLSYPVLAGEVRTLCPAAKPWGDAVPFRYGEIWPEGYPTHWEQDSIVRKNGLVLLERDFLDYNSNKAVLMCEFKDRSSIEIPIHGLLLRCGMTLRNYDSKKKPTEWLNVWCISDDALGPKR